LGSSSLCTCRICHNIGHSQQRLPLTVALLFLVALAPLKLEDDHFGPSRLPHNGPYDASLIEVGASNGDLVALPKHEHRCDLDTVPRRARELFHCDRIALTHTVLLSPGLDNSVHTDPAFSRS